MSNILEFVKKRFAEASEPYVQLLNKVIGKKEEKQEQNANKEVLIVKNLELREHPRLP